MAIAVLDESEITELIRKAVALATADLRDELERSRTPELMTKDQLAKYLECHVSSINRFMKEGMPVERGPRFRKCCVDAWLKNQDFCSLCQCSSSTTESGSDRGIQNIKRLDGGSTNDLARAA